MHNVNINMKNFNVTNYDCDVRPFEFKVNLEDLSGLTKESEMSTRYQKTDIFGKKLYYTTVNRKYVEVTEDDIQKYDVNPIYLTKTEVKKVNLVNYPTKFTFQEILEHKKKELLHDTDFTECLLYECNLNELVDTEYAFNGCDSGFKIINIHKDGGKSKLHIETNKDSIKEIKLFFDNLDVEYSVNGNDFTNYTESIKSNDDIASIDIILTNNSGEDIKLTNVYILAK